MEKRKSIKSAVRRAMMRCAGAVLACAMLFCVCRSGGASLAATSELSDATVKSYEDQIASLQAEQKRIQQNLTKLQKDSASMQEYKAELDSYLDTTARKMEAANTLISELDKKIAEKTEQIESNTTEYDRMYQKFLDMIVVNYEEGEASYLGLILGADSLGDFLSRLDRVSSMLEYNKGVMSELETTGEQLERDRLALEEAVALQKATIEELEKEEADYQSKCDDVIAKIAALGKDQAAAQKELAKNQAAEAELDKQLEEYLLELQKKNQAQMQSGEWYWPLPLDSGAYCSSVYGWRLLYGVWDFHRGWDLACWLGTEIYAAKSGTVVISTYHYSYGNYIVIDHGTDANGNAISTVYAHCSKLLVSVGDKVEKGQLIAKVGTTGNSTGYHLHFEFRKNGKYDDPFNYISDPYVSVGASRYNKW